MTRYTKNGVLYTSWFFGPDDDLLLALHVLITVLRDGEQKCALLTQSDLTCDTSPAPVVIWLGSNASDFQFSQTLHDFAERTGVQRVYWMMTSKKP